MKLIRFTINAKVEFGQTVGVVVELPSSLHRQEPDEHIIYSNQQILEVQLNNAFALKWSEGHQWRGEMLFSGDQFTCRFVVFHESTNISENISTSSLCLPQRNLIEIEEGFTRRFCLLTEQFTCATPSHPFEDSTKSKVFDINETFNQRKIRLAVYAESGCQMFVQGNIPEISSPQCLQENSKQADNISLYAREFSIPLRTDYMRYFFIKNLQSIERGIGRYLQFSEGQRKPTSVFYSEYQADYFRKTLQYSEINEKLVIGTFINCAEDIEELHSIGVTAIICLQSDSDLKRKYVNQNDMRILAKTKEIVYRHVPIRDNDPVHFIERAPEALRNLENLAKAEHKVYVHCTAGIGRAPQTAILHLIITGKLSLEQASQTVFRKRTVAQPNRDAIFQVLENLFEDSYHD